MDENVKLLNLRLDGVISSFLTIATNYTLATITPIILH